MLRDSSYLYCEYGTPLWLKIVIFAPVAVYFVGMAFGLFYWKKTLPVIFLGVFFPVVLIIAVEADRTIGSFIPQPPTAQQIDAYTEKGKLNHSKLSRDSNIPENHMSEVRQLSKTSVGFTGDGVNCVVQYKGEPYNLDFRYFVVGYDLTCK